MFGGYQSILYSISEKPLEYWSKKRSPTGHISKVVDNDLLENVVEIQDVEGSSVANTYIACPSDSQQQLSISLPFLILIIKNLNLECRIKLQILDSNQLRHYFQFHFSNSEDKYARNSTFSHIKVQLEPGWNRLELDLHNLTDTIFKSKYEKTERLQICANCRLRRIYFIDRRYGEQEICPKLYRNFLDLYMTKWGISKVNVEAQTNESCIENEKEKRSSAQSTSEKHLQMFHDKFYRDVQTRCHKVIENFFNKYPTRVGEITEFLRQARIKSYAVPLNNEKSKNYNEPMSMDILSNGALRTCKQLIEKKPLKIAEENWVYRYLNLNDKAKPNKVAYAMKQQRISSPKTIFDLKEAYKRNASKRSN
ncbi:uncharacterized protein [Prorops nasuta]|uniref:uncharacterized protein n=1 Tax=Prorops nasuta TaxID=863751 RepID=UPI0034CE8C4F